MWYPCILNAEELPEITRCGALFHFLECRDALLPLLTDQLSGQLDDNANKPDHEACSQLLSSVLEVLDRKDVVSMNCQGCKLRLILLLRSYGKEIFLTDALRNYEVLMLTEIVLHCCLVLSISLHVKELCLKRSCERLS